MKKICMFLGSTLFTVLFVHASLSLAQVELVNINGMVTFNDTPVVAMVLANGQYMFTCGSAVGEYSLTVPPDGNGQVEVGWRIEGQHLLVWVDDDGPGLEETRDVFVPFFTTKAKGSGIGLALSRQIAEAHGGYLTLENRSDENGCRACIWLPLEQGTGQEKYTSKSGG